jgi:hypothetical protein
VVTTRIQTTRRRLGPARAGTAALRRHAAWPLAAAGATAGRLRLPSFTHASLAAGGLLALVIAYLLVGTQATQTSYELDSLRARNGQLQAEQDQLRYQDARMRSQAGVAQAAASAGLQHGNPPRYVRAQPVQVDLTAPIGPDRPDDTPLWQRALAAIGAR